MRFTEALLIALAIVETKATRNDECYNCSHRNDCHIMNRYNAQQQELWLIKYQCQDPYYDDSNNFYKLVPERDGSFVCCSKIIWEIENNMKISNPKIVYFEPNVIQRKYFNYAEGNEGFYSNIQLTNTQATNSMYDMMTVRAIQPYFNNNPLPVKPYLPGVKNNAPSIGKKQNLEQQCVPTSFPPKPETECCGREATDSSRITGSKNLPSITDLASFPNNWVTEFNGFPPQLNNTLMPRRRSGSIRNRRRRATLKETPNITIGQRISGGKETEFEQFPWTVHLKTTFDFGGRRESFNCGGSLISSKYVLTAAHCLYDTNSTIANVEVYFAEYNKQTFPKDCKTVLGVGEKCIENLLMYGENVILHSQYDYEGLINDIALIRLRGTAPYTDYIRPICILPINLDRPEYLNLPLAVAGWGRNGPYRSDIKQSTVVNVVTQEKCKKYYPSLYKNHLCAVGHTGEDTCKGDSGGPLMTVYDGKHFVVGIVSGKRAGDPCGTSVPSLYTNVYHYIDWISSNIKN